MGTQSITELDEPLLIGAVVRFPGIIDHPGIEFLLGLDGSFGTGEHAIGSMNRAVFLTLTAGKLISWKRKVFSLK